MGASIARMSDDTGFALRRRTFMQIGFKAPTTGVADRDGFRPGPDRTEGSCGLPTSRSSDPQSCLPRNLQCRSIPIPARTGASSRPGASARVALEQLTTRPLSPGDEEARFVLWSMCAAPPAVLTAKCWFPPLIRLQGRLTLGIGLSGWCREAVRGNRRPPFDDRGWGTRERDGWQRARNSSQPTETPKFTARM